MYNSAKGKREPYIIKAQQIGALVQDSVSVKSFQTSKDFPTTIKTPFSDAGPRCNKGLASIINNLLNPPNLSSFKLENNVKFELSDEENNLLDSLYIGIEKSINAFKAQYAYRSYQYQALISCGINGQIATKVTEDGYMAYDLDSFVVSRSRASEKPQWAIFEECIYNEEGKEIPQYIYVDWGENTVHLQVGDRKPELMEGEQAIQYVVSSLTTARNQDYFPSIFADHYGVLKSINKSWESMEEAQDLAGYNIQTYTGPASISTKDLARVPRRSVIRVPSHDILKWQGVDATKLSNWSFIATIASQREQQLLTSFGIGLLQRAGQLQTATEVRAIVNELMALTGPVAIVWSDTFTAPILKAEMAVLKTKDKLENALNAQGLSLTPELKEKLMIPVVVSGVSAFARGENAEAMLGGLQKVISTTAGIPQAQEQIAGSIRFDQVLREYLDNTGVNTSKILQDYVPPQQIQSEGATPDQSQVAAVSSLPPELIASLPANIQGAGPEVIASYLLNNQNNQ